MSNKDTERPSKRHYPPIYEKAIPIALALIALAFIVTLAIVLGVLLGLFPGN